MLEVEKAGDGTGTVTSTPPGIDCGGACSALFPLGRNVSLTATAEPGSVFSGWQGGCTGTSSCTLLVAQATHVVAVFSRSRRAESLSVSKKGNGTVTSEPSGIVCGPVCTAQFPRGRRVELIPFPSPGSVFAGWRGVDCPGQASCALVLERPTRATAVFRKTDETIRLKVELDGDGVGSVVSDPFGIDCGATCEAEFRKGDEVTLTPQNGLDSTFGGWDGGGCSGTESCTIVLDEDTTVVARFDPSSTPTETLKASLAGDGQGTVTSTPAGIRCEQACEAPFPVDSQITLVAEPSEGSTFVAWKGGGACDGTSSAECVITMSGTQEVAAIFSLKPTLFTLSVSIVEDGGTGNVASNPPGIRCRPGCRRLFRAGRTVELTATRSENSSFVGWEGDCSGFTCVLTMDADHAVSARFQTSVD